MAEQLHEASCPRDTDGDGDCAACARNPDAHVNVVWASEPVGKLDLTPPAGVDNPPLNPEYVRLFQDPDVKVFRPDGGSQPAEGWDAERLARLFHETYERLAPDFGYRTRDASAKPWEQVPEDSRALMTATCAEVLARLVGPWEPASDAPNLLLTEGQAGEPAEQPEPVAKCPHGYERGEHHWFSCMGVSPAGQQPS